MTFCVAVGVVVRNCAQKQMIGIYTRGVVAFVQHIHAFWYWAVLQFVCNAVSRAHSAIVPDLPIASNILACLPFPAGFWPAFIYFTPKPLTKRWLGQRGDLWRARCSGIVPENKPNGLAFDMSKSTCGFSCNWGGLSTAAHAQSAWIRWYEGMILAAIVTMNKLAWPTIKNGGFLPTTTMTITVRDFLCGFLRGMISHVDTFLSRFGHATGCYQHRRGDSIGELYYTTSGA
jgi:hypothetical protein